jgi:hypothetical protein
MVCRVSCYISLKKNQKKLKCDDLTGLGNVYMFLMGLFVEKRRTKNEKIEKRREKSLYP